MDLGPYLPLSSRPRVDESAVSSNWSRPMGGVLLQLADLLGETAPERWTTVEAPSLDLLNALARTKRDRLAGVSGPGEASERIRALAIQRMTGRPRTRVGTLGVVLAAGYDTARLLDATLVVDPAVTGAVALARAASGPFAVRTVAASRTLVATDDGWRIGRGPAIEGTAEAIVLFLYGRGHVPGARSADGT